MGKRHIEDRVAKIIRESIQKAVETRIIREAIKMHASNDSDLVYYIPKYMTKEITHFLHKISQLSTVARNSNCGEVNVETNTVVKTFNTKKGPKDVEFLEITVVPVMPEIKVEGYKFLGSITPMSVIIDGEPKEHMIVALSEEFKGNEHYESILKNSSQTMRCDLCHRETSRGIYLCFLEEATGKVLKLGGNCARRYFGIDVSKKIRDLFNGLNNLGSEPYLQIAYDYNELFNEWDADVVGKYTTPVMASIRQLVEPDELGNDIIDIAVMRGTTAIVERGPNCSMKSSMASAIGFENMIEDIKMRSMEKGKIQRSIFNKLIADAMEKFPRSFEVRQQAEELKVEFFQYGAKFFYNMEPQNDFQTRVQDTGLLITGGYIQKKRLNPSKHINIIPYCVQEYFKYKASQNPVEGSENMASPIEPFDGEMTFTGVKIDSVDIRQTRNLKNYYAVIGITSDNKIIKWNVWDNAPAYNRGDVINLVASYNHRFKNLENVKVIADNANADAAEAVEEVPMNYPNDGYRYKNEVFTVIRISPQYKFLVVKNKRDNCEYYIANINYGGYSYYDRYATYKFDLNGLTEGSEITISGTAKSYEKKDGSIGHKLAIVKGLPASGELYGSDDDYDVNWY